MLQIAKKLLRVRTYLKLTLALALSMGLVGLLYQTSLTKSISRKLSLSHVNPRVFVRESRCLSNKGSRAGVDCSAIFEDSEYVIKHKTNYSPHLDSGCELEELVKDCHLLRTAHRYDWKEQLLDTDGDHFPIAYAMKIHKSPEQAEQLLRAIFHPHNTYFVHVDKKSPVHIQNLFVNLSRCFDNVHVIENNIGVGYATFDMIVAEMMLMSGCRNASDSWKYYINITGQEFPLKTNWEIIQILKLLNGTNDVESYPFDEAELHNRILSRIQLPFPRDVKPYKGSAYGMFSRAFVDFILDSPIAKEIIYFFQNTHAPEETVWATLNRVPEAPGGISVDTRHDAYQHLSKAVVWLWDKPRCHGQFVRAVCVYGAGDLMWLRSRPEIFANKFDIGMDRLAIDCLEEEIENRTITPDRRLLNFNFYHHLPQMLQ